MAATTGSNVAFSGMHRAVAGDNEQERFLADVFDRLWDRYRERVNWVREYERVVRAAGGTFVNDHIAFRTIGSQQPAAGIFTLGRIFESLGYRAANCYQFPDKFLSSIHFQHPNGNFPKLFISELQTWKLSRTARETIDRAVKTHRPPLASDVLAEVAALGTSAPNNRDELLATIVREIEELPWQAPAKDEVLAVNKESQFAAWVLVHGYNVNHFTSLINSHGVAALDDIEKTIAALQKAGIPMKAEIEGARGTKLRQTATEAAMVDVPVREGGTVTKMPWTYAYFELAERGDITDPETGKRGRFEGFLGPQATQLFEMTRVDGKRGT